MDQDNLLSAYSAIAYERNERKYPPTLRCPSEVYGWLESVEEDAATPHSSSIFASTAAGQNPQRSATNTLERELHAATPELSIGSSAQMTEDRNVVATPVLSFADCLSESYYDKCGYGTHPFWAPKEYSTLPLPTLHSVAFPDSTVVQTAAGTWICKICHEESTERNDFCQCKTRVYRPPTFYKSRRYRGLGRNAAKSFPSLLHQPPSNPGQPSNTGTREPSPEQEPAGFRSDQSSSQQTRSVELYTTTLQDSEDCIDPRLLSNSSVPGPPQLIIRPKGDLVGTSTSYTRHKRTNVVSQRTTPLETPAPFQPSRFTSPNNLRRKPKSLPGYGLRPYGTQAMPRTPLTDTLRNNCKVTETRHKLSATTSSLSGIPITPQSHGREAKRFCADPSLDQDSDLLLLKDNLPPPLAPYTHVHNQESRPYSLEKLIERWISKYPREFPDDANISRIVNMAEGSLNGEEVKECFREIFWPTADQDSNFHSRGMITYGSNLSTDFSQAHTPDPTPQNTDRNVANIIPKAKGGIYLSHEACEKAPRSDQTISTNRTGENGLGDVHNDFEKTDPAKEEVQSRDSRLEGTTIDGEDNDSLRHMQSDKYYFKPEVIQDSRNECVSDDPEKKTPGSDHCLMFDTQSEGSTAIVGVGSLVDTACATPELISIVGAALEAEYGSEPIVATLLPIICSIFDEKDFSFREEEFHFDQTSPGEVSSCYDGTTGNSSSSGSPGSLATGSSAYTDITGSRSSRALEYSGQDNSSPSSEKTPNRQAECATADKQLNAIGRDRAKLQCHFNARDPDLKCINPLASKAASGKSGYGFAKLDHLKEHYRTHHFFYQCVSCGELFNIEEKHRAHERSRPACDTIPEDRLADIGRGDGVTERIKEEFKTREEKLDRETRNAREAWVHKNIIEFVGDGVEKNERNQLRSWYTMWLVLFPGEGVREHPFLKNSASIPKGEKFVEAFQRIVEAKGERNKNQALSPPQRQMCVDALREILNIVNKVRQNAPGLTPKQSTPMSDERSQQSSVLRVGSSGNLITAKRSMSNIEGTMGPPPPKRQRTNPHSRDITPLPNGHRLADNRHGYIAQPTMQSDLILSELRAGSKSSNNSVKPPDLSLSVNPTLFEVGRETSPSDNFGPSNNPIPSATTKHDLQDDFNTVGNSSTSLGLEMDWAHFDDFLRDPSENQDCEKDAEPDVGDYCATTEDLPFFEPDAML